LDIKNILSQYWGHKSFRPLQEDIINSVLEGNDTLALLPTGGGKSICFQVPAMAMEGICIVITPLIALMKDQVEHLLEKGIKAVAIYSGMNQYEIDLAYNHCVFGGVKFLYISPERLETDKLLGHLRQMNVNLLAVDEAHCVSQWGYDFRPQYLQIAKAREILPEEIKRLGGNVDVVSAYRTVKPKEKTDEIRKMFQEKKIDVVTFTSSSTVENFVGMFKTGFPPF